MANTKAKDDVNPQDARFVFECVRNIDSDGKVDLAKVANVLGYTNIASVGNRFRDLRKRYNFHSLECKNQAGTTKTRAAAKSTTAARTTRSSSAKAAGGAAAKKKTGTARKGAKVSSAKPTPATGPVVKGEEFSSDDSEATIDESLETDEEEEKGSNMKKK